MCIRLLCRLFVLFLLVSEYLCLENPYTILKVEKKASLVEIKKSYKQLAKEWHPDKSDHAEAEKKFIEIKQAYELLSDPERRKAYDLYGITNEDFQRNRPDYSQYQRNDPFDDLFSQHHFFQNQDINFFHKLSITTKYYESNVLPKSKNQPHILFFYSDWCFACIRAASAFKKIIESFQNVGIVFATVNAGHEQHLVRKCSIHSLPALVMILDEHAYVYKENSFTLQKVADFIRQKLPYKLVPQINDDSLDAFLSGWHDNRVRALVFEPRQQPRLRYLLSAFNYKNLVHFGFIQTMKPECRNVIERYKINQNLDTLLLFNEDSLRPLASVSMSDIPLETLHNIIKANQYLALPRLSSQNMLDGICPMEWNRSKKRLCVILITENSASHDYARHVVRRIAIESSYSERVKFAYIYREKQKEFINALSSVNNGEDNALKIVVIWRRDAKHVKFEWIPEAKLEETSSVEIDEENFNQTKRKIDEIVQKLLRSSEALAFEAEVLNRTCRRCYNKDGLNDEDIKNKRVNCQECRKIKNDDQKKRYKIFTEYIYSKTRVEKIANLMTFLEVKELCAETLVDKVNDLIQGKDRFKIGVTSRNALASRIMSGYALKNGWLEFQPQQLIFRCRWIENAAQVEQYLIRFYKGKNEERAPGDPYCMNITEKLNAGNCTYEDDDEFVVYVELNDTSKVLQARSFNFFCDFCPEGFETKTDLRSHEHQVHFDEWMTCRECGMQFDNLAMLHKHIKGHNVSKLPLFKSSNDTEITIQTLRMQLSENHNLATKSAIEKLHFEEQNKYNLAQLEKVTAQLERWKIKFVEEKKEKEKWKAMVIDAEKQYVEAQRIKNIEIGKSFHHKAVEAFAALFPLTVDDWQTLRKEFKEYLQSASLEMKEIRKDENSFYRSIAFLMLGDEALHAIVRKDVFNTIVLNRSEYEVYIEEDFIEFIQKCQSTSNKPTFVEFQTCADLFNAELHFYAYGEDPFFIIKPRGGVATKKLMIFYEEFKFFNVIQNPLLQTSNIALLNVEL